MSVLPGRYPGPREFLRSSAGIPKVDPAALKLHPDECCFMRRSWSWSFWGKNLKKTDSKFPN